MAKINLKIKKKVLLSGNEAMARGAYEAGIKLATSYPGTPATEIMDYLLKLKSDDFYAEWSSNEKVALELCFGASTMNQRSLCSMKANGLNLCIDSLMSITKKGIKGGLVVVVVDDPDVRYCDVRQDSRKFMKVIGFPILEPKTLNDCLKMTKNAFELSEEIERPVFISLDNKLGHLYSPIEIGKRIKPIKANFDKTKHKFNPYSKEREEIIPYFCPACPHESFYKNLKIPKSFVINGDIGCYEMAGFGNNKKNEYKLVREIIDTLFVMGSGVNVSQGQLICGQRSIALCGDSTFWHCGINGLINAAYNKHNIIFVIMDNSCVAMTGQHPVPQISIEKVCKDLGCYVEIVNPYFKNPIQNAINKAIKNKNRINVIISRAPCMLKKQHEIRNKG